MKFLEYLFGRNIEVPSDRIFIEEENLVKSKLQSLNRTQDKTEEGNKIYIDRHSSQKWEKYEFFGGEDDRSWLTGLRIYPLPNNEDIFKLMLRTKYLSEIRIALTYVWIKYYKNEQVREQLLELLENSVNELSLERFEVIYEAFHLGEATNTRNIMNVPLDILKKDWEYFENLVNRANQIRILLAVKEMVK